MDLIIQIVIGVFVAGVGLFMNLFGYRFFQILLGAVGFLLGFWLGATGFQDLFGSTMLMTILSWIAGAALGLLFGYMAYAVYIIGLFVLAFMTGYWLLASIAGLLGLSGSGVGTVCLGTLATLAFVAAFFYFNLQKYIIILLSALAGAWFVLAGVLTLLGRVEYYHLGTGLAEHIVRTSPFWLLVGLVLVVVGAVFQFINTKGLKEEWTTPKLPGAQNT
jgi:hypothetical protein